MQSPAVLEYIENIRSSQLDDNIKDVVISLLETSTDENIALVFGKISKILNDQLSTQTYALSLLKKNEETLLKLQGMMNGNQGTNIVTPVQDATTPTQQVSPVMPEVQTPMPTVHTDDVQPIELSLDEKKKLEEEETKKKIDNVMNQLQAMKPDAVIDASTQTQVAAQ